ncbi:MAG: GNAT family N-acetyltransferase [Anaerolineales bacterium]
MTSKIPTLTTKRLRLRPFRMDDAPAVQELAGAYSIAAHTTNIPHPYPDGAAEEWISTHAETFEQGTGVHFAITLKKKGILVGAIGIFIKKQHQLGELGYWIGEPYRNQGYCTEAAREVVRYGFEELDLNRIQARHMTKNPASGRVMESIGMQREGTLRQSLHRFDSFEDAHIYAILREEFKANSEAS